MKNFIFERKWVNDESENSFNSDNPNNPNFLPKIDHIKHKVSLNLKITPLTSQNEIFPQFSKTTKLEHNFMSGKQTI